VHKNAAGAHPLYDSGNERIQERDGRRPTLGDGHAVVMAEMVHEFSEGVAGFRVRAFAEKRGNVWIGWLEFRPERGKARKTGEETSQSSKEAVEYWATGLEPVYLEGALERAK
jgi:hypothetical protein